LAVITIVVLVGDRVSGAAGSALTREVANRELRAFLLQVGSRPAPVRVWPPLSPDGLRLVYEAERLSGRGSRSVTGPLAEGGLARAGERAGTDVVFGPLRDLGPRHLPGELPTPA
jgi:hypothetical protein